MSLLRIVISSIIYLGLLTLDLKSQTTYQKAKDIHNGFQIFVGTTQADFLNQRYLSNLNNKVLKKKFGYSFSVAAVSYPFSYYLDFFNASWENSDFVAQGLSNSYSGLNLGSDVMLVPSFKSFQPFVGLSYQYSNLALEQSTSDDIKTFSKANTEGLYAKVGLQLTMFKVLALKSFYQKSVIVPDLRQNYRFEIGIGLNYSNIASLSSKYQYR